MIELESAGLKNVVVFKDAYLPISTSNNLVVVTGHNKDSTIAEDQKNAVGKSLAFSAVPNLYFQSSPLSTKKNSKRDLLDAKDSCTTIICKNRGTRYKVEQRPNKYVIYEEQDGKFVDQQVRTDKIQRQILTKIFHLSPLEFYSYVYIQNQRPLDFQIGSPSERLNFITEIFQLDIYDKLRHHFHAKLSTVKEDEIRFQVIQTKLQSAYEALANLTWTSKSKQQLDILKHKLNKVERKASRRLTQVQELTGLLSAIDNVLHIDNKLDKLRSDYPFDTAPEVTIKSLKKDIRIRQELKLYRAQLADYEVNCAELEAKLKHMQKPEQTEQQLFDQLQTNTDTRQELLTDIKSLKSKQEQQERLDQELTTIDKSMRIININFKKARSVKNVDKKISALETNLRLEKVLHHNKCDNAVCPTCMQDIDIDAIRKLIKYTKNKLDYLNRVRKLQQLLQKQQELLDEKKGYKDNTKKLKKLTKKLQHCDNNITGIKQRLIYVSKYWSITNSLKALRKTKPTKPNIHLRHPELSDEDIERYSELCQKVLRLLAAKESLFDEHSKDVNGVTLRKICKIPAKIRTHKQQLTAELKTLDKESKTLTTRSKDLNVKVRTLELSRERYTVLEKQRLELEKELEDIKPLLEQRKVYEALVKAYSKKGLKINAARSVLRLLESKLNEYSDIIFFEPHRFNITVVPQGISCTVTRVKNNRTSDVSLLSGSETNCFRLLFMVAMLSLVPEDRRTNFVVLDEADSAMDDAARQKYVNSFIPVLCEVVPHVFVITPGDPYMYSNAEIWTVVKENGISTILKDGKPLKQATKHEKRQKEIA